eukprot:CAMPEP_0181232308 /NCGR_PEP_ID=MMETSP1096-20121128/35653_1 /TAXON_ID=156174 ORGANISM="Chrysochromulina ericina, Strain CCMP281" /NCGR_SAMPLE_ID=MMETSP1096 /ASSEMBLY_ACC=CAM_ASM_000453 /LENGTH=87 /DNA_ID=CAMNT_0023326573 /DNA_START=395 /DNA_END=658 /DNA_ORIENTATION=+
MCKEAAQWLLMNESCHASFVDRSGHLLDLIDPNGREGAHLAFSHKHVEHHINRPMLVQLGEHPLQCQAALLACAIGRQVNVRGWVIT